MGANIYLIIIIPGVILAVILSYIAYKIFKK